MAMEVMLAGIQGVNNVIGTRGFFKNKWGEEWGEATHHTHTHTLTQDEVI